MSDEIFKPHDFQIRNLTIYSGQQNQRLFHYPWSYEYENFPKFK